jgi:hypothetical protein
LAGSSWSGARKDEVELFQTPPIISY